MSDYPEEFDREMLTWHVRQQMKDRKISLIEVQNAFSMGEVKPNLPSKKHQIAYVLDLPVDLIVIYDPEKNNIVTVFYNDDQGATHGSLINRELPDFNILRGSNGHI